MQSNNTPHNTTVLTTIMMVALVAAATLLKGVVQSAYFFNGTLYMDINDAAAWRIGWGVACVVVVAICAVGMMVTVWLNKHHNNN